MNSYKINTASKAQIIQHFTECEFTPRLESYLNLAHYSEKILKNAVRFECWVNGSLAGLTALYANDMATKRSFITMASVSSHYGGEGIGSTLIKQAISYAIENGFENISLEVFPTNIRAMKLYEKIGFRKVHTDGDKINMELVLEKND